MSYEWCVDCADESEGQGLIDTDDFPEAYNSIDGLPRCERCQEKQILEEIDILLGHAEGKSEGHL